MVEMNKYIMWYSSVAWGEKKNAFDFQEGFPVCLNPLHVSDVCRASFLLCHLLDLDVKWLNCGVTAYVFFGV